MGLVGARGVLGTDLVGARGVLVTPTTQLVDVDPVHVAIQNRVSAASQDTIEAERMIVKNAVKMKLAAKVIRRNVERRTIDLATIRIKMEIQCSYKGLFWRNLQDHCLFEVME